MDSRLRHRLTVGILIYNTLLETGGVLISDVVDIVMDLEIHPL